MSQLDGTQDYYSPDAGTVEGPVFCGVCGDEMTLVKRDSRGPRGFAQAMGMAQRGETNTGSPHDIYSCPNIEEYWHCQAKALRESAQRTVSGRQEREFLDEANEIILTRKHTKEISKYIF
jgi:hypothetical protein